MSIKILQKPKLINRFIKDVFPIVKEELNSWKTMAYEIPDPVLSQQALSSIKKKSFHCQGGAIYSLYTGKVNPDNIRFIVALQTISDYLDNLCDRVGIEDEKSFLQLHKAIINALDPNSKIEDYYLLYPHNNDGGYLNDLVSTCRNYILSLSSYELVYEQVLFLGKLYCEMQSIKHIKVSERNMALEKWAKQYHHLYPEISPWEFSAASGSTLGIFLLCTLAEEKHLTDKQVNDTVNAYFPWICGLHILLDYFIDQKEDILNDDLNFVSFYKDEEEKKERLYLFLSQSFKNTSYLNHHYFHEMIIQGLLAMYLSDKKASFESEKDITNSLLNNSGGKTKILYQICKTLRNKDIISS